MDRQRFALSWGRKVFFGLLWPLLVLLSLVFLKSGLLPKDSTSVFYFVFTTVGYYGLLTAILYFLFYAPFAVLFPTYYFVRLWSALLIVMSCALIFLDALVFSEYRFHINRLVFELLSAKGPALIFNGSLTPYFVAAGVGVFIFFFVWVRGEWTWRIMQRRFSNPVKNWYFILIVVCLGISHYIWKNQRTSFYGNEITLASLYPLNYQEIFFPKSLSEVAASRSRFHYPKKDLKCQQKTKPNIIFIVAEGLMNHSLSEESTPFLVHLRDHGMNFTTHLTGGGGADDNLFRILYGIPATYRPESPASPLISEAQKEGYTFSLISERTVPGIPVSPVRYEDWKISDTEDGAPKFFFFELGFSDSSVTDQKVSDIFSRLQKADLLSGSSVVVTSLESSQWEPVPMILILPDRTHGNWGHRTTHYDIAPTILSKLFHCKTSFSAYSYGKSLTESPARDWEIFGDEHTFRIVDFTNHNVIETDWHGRVNSGGVDRGELVLKASREISRFYR